MEGAPVTLLSIAVLKARGYEVPFIPSGQGVGIYKDQKLLFHGAQHKSPLPYRHPVTHSPPIDIDIDIDIDKQEDSPRDDIPPKKGQPHYVAASTNFDMDTVRDVLWLHKRMGHSSRLTMYQSIMHGTVTGLPDGLKPSQVNNIVKNVN